MDRRLNSHNQQTEHTIDEEEEDAYVLLSGLTGLYAGLSHLVRQRKRIYRPLRTDPESCYEKVHRYLSGHPATIFNKIRMTTSAFRMLTSVIEERQLFQASNQACIKEKIMSKYAIQMMGVDAMKTKQN